MHVDRFALALLVAGGAGLLAVGATINADDSATDVTVPEDLADASTSVDGTAFAHAGVAPHLVERILDLLRDPHVAPTWPEGYPYFSMYNREAPVPPQCYTRTNGFHNPCYVCHQAEIPGRENVMNDEGLQAAYEFSDVGFRNHWLNLFEDRRDRAAAISDEAIVEWVRQDNYSDLAPRLRAAGFEGYIPDLDDLESGALAFDEVGFAKDGSGWVAFNYKPMPSTFWPTNGATDDVMIRLPEAFRTTEAGAPSLDAYRANLGLLELAIKDVDRIGCLPVDETALGIDLDGDGELGTAHEVIRRATYVGGASSIDVFDTMYPQGAEFLHTVRYLDVADDGTITVSRRMKEVRYMYRALERRKSWAEYHYRDEALDKEFGMLPRHEPRKSRRALESETGWQLAGFIEDVNGDLRTQTFEETVFCMGCHNSMGATIDKTFSFARKIDGPRGYGYIDLQDMPDAPNMTVPGETPITDGEILVYLDRVGGGSEFRNNAEMAERWFREDGTVDRERVLGNDVYTLLAPSPERAWALNKAYRVLVQDQDYFLGRDPVLEPPANVYDLIDPETAPVLPEARRFRWDIRLDWAAVMDLSPETPSEDDTEDALGRAGDERRVGAD